MNVNMSEILHFSPAHERGIYTGSGTHIPLQTRAPCWFWRRVLARSIGKTQVTPTRPATPPLISLAGRLKDTANRSTWTRTSSHVMGHTNSMLVYTSGCIHRYDNKTLMQRVLPDFLVSHSDGSPLWSLPLLLDSQQQFFQPVFVTQVQLKALPTRPSCPQNCHNTNKT